MARPDTCMLNPELVQHQPCQGSSSHGSEQSQVFAQRKNCYNCKIQTVTQQYNYVSTVILIKEKELTAHGKNKGLARKDGPFVQSLDSTLASFNVQRQAYYSGTFVGNHVHRTLKVNNKKWESKLKCHVIVFEQEANTKTLCRSIPHLAESRCPELVTKAKFVASTFEKAFSQFDRCHSLYDSSKQLSDGEIRDLGIHKQSIIHMNYVLLCSFCLQSHLSPTS